MRSCRITTRPALLRSGLVAHEQAAKQIESGLPVSPIVQMNIELQDLESKRFAAEVALGWSVSAVKQSNASRNGIWPSCSATRSKSSSGANNQERIGVVPMARVFVINQPTCMGCGMVRNACNCGSEENRQASTLRGQFPQRCPCQSRRRAGP